MNNVKKVVFEYTLLINTMYNNIRLKGVNELVKVLLN